MPWPPAACRERRGGRWSRRPGPATCRKGSRLWRNRDAGRIRPQLLQVVKRPCLWVEEVHDDVSAVHQQPLRRGSESAGGGGGVRGEPFGVPDGTPQSSQDGFNMFFERAQLGAAAGRADNEEIGHVGERPQVHHDHTLSLLLEGRSGGGQRRVLTIK